MIARWSFAVLMIVLVVWLYWLTYRQQVLIDLAEQIVDRDHVLVSPSPFEQLRRLGQKIAERTAPVMADEPEPVSVHEALKPLFTPPERRPSPRPRVEPEPTVPMERAWDESAAELPAEVEQDEWQAKWDAEYAAAMARIEEMAKGRDGQR